MSDDFSQMESHIESAVCGLRSVQGAGKYPKKVCIAAMYGANMLNVRKGAISNLRHDNDRLIEENKQQRESLDAFRELVKAQTKTMSELVEENLALKQENAELREALLGLIDCKGILTSDKGCVIRAKYLLNKNDS